MSFDFFHQCNNYPWFNNWPINVVWQYKIWCPIWLLLLDATLRCATFLFNLFMVLIDHVNYKIMHKWTFPKTFIKIGKYNELVLNLHRHNLLVIANFFLSFSYVGDLTTFAVDPPIKWYTFSILECCYTWEAPSNH